MGKASQRKKAKKALTTAQQKGPKKQPAKSAAKPAKPKKSKKVTIEAIEKKAHAVETALDKALHKAEEVTAEKQEAGASLRASFEAAKSLAQQTFSNFREGLDPEKLTALKKEVKYLVRRGAFYLTGIAAVVVILVVVELHSNNRVFPGTTAGGVDVGFLPLAQAKEKLTSEIEQYLNQPLIFSFEGDTFEVTAEEIGLRLGIDQTLARLPVFQFEQEHPAHLVATLMTERSVASDYTLDGDTIMKVLEEKLQLQDRRARNAGIVYRDNALHIDPESEGYTINREKLIKDIRRNIDNLSTDTIEIEIVEEHPRITAQELELEKDALIARLNRPITLVTEDGSLTVTPVNHLDAVSFEENSALTIEGREEVPLVLGEGQVNLAHANPVNISSKIQVALDPEKMQPYLYENLIKDIETPVSPANIYRNEEGQVIIEGTGENGRSVPVGRLVEAITLAANNGIETVPVPVLVDRAPLTISEDLRKLGIRELIATGHSSYYGSPPNRMFNIEFGTAKYNGMLIAPGEEFSFNAHLGEVDAQSGFLPEKVIKQNKVELEYGGGICQVSTTMYRAALLAGLPITERSPHSWKVSYYGQSMGHGLDATIYPGVADVKFLNDTPGHILIQAYTNGPEAYFKVYGTDDGRKVVMDGPYGGGLSWRWNRILTKNGEEQVEEIWSQYRPIPAPEPPPPPPDPVDEGF